MKYFSFLVALLSAIFFSSLTLHSQTETFISDDFEKPFKEGLASGWENNSSWAKVVMEYAVETENPHSGKQAQKMSCKNFTSGAAQIRLIQRFSLEKNRIYRLSIWLRSDRDMNIDLRIMRPVAPYSQYFGGVLAVTKNWKEFVIEAPSEGSDESTTLILRFTQEASLWIDDLSFVKTARIQELARRFTPPSQPIPRDFFGFHLHLHQGRKTSFPDIGFGMIRLWDTRTSWPYLEKEKGQWDFSKLDRYVQLASEKGVKVLLPLGLSPTWASSRPQEFSAYNKDTNNTSFGWAAEPKNLDDWANYVTTVAERYRGRILHYEIWNEVNEHLFYSGKPETLVELHRVARAALKKVDSSIQLVGSSCVGETGYLNGLYRLGLGNHVDAAAFHFYTWDFPESMLRRADEVKAALKENSLPHLPIWNTEAGWFIGSSQTKVQGTKLLGHESTKVHPPKNAGNFIIRAHLLAWGLGIERYFFYAWDNNLMGLIERDETPKEIVPAYERFIKGMNGAVMNTLELDAGGNWLAVCTDPQGKKFYFSWRQEGESKSEAPKGSKISGGEDIWGQKTALLDGARLPVSEIPVRWE